MSIGVGNWNKETYGSFNFGTVCGYLRSNWIDPINHAIEFHWRGYRVEDRTLSIYPGNIIRIRFPQWPAKSFEGEGSSDLLGPCKIWGVFDEVANTDKKILMMLPTWRNGYRQLNGENHVGAGVTGLNGAMLGI